MPNIETMTAKAKAPEKLRSLISLTPTEFENLVFDLLIVRGMINVAWRTPGADGGRDIEGVTVATDFSGIQTSEKWYVECKRYTRSVDWPTIYGKLAYADVNRADTLLLCTSATFSPTAVSRVNDWNKTRRTPCIRLWPRHQFESIIQNHPDLLLKYGLSASPTTPGASLISLALSLSKTVDSHYSDLIFHGNTPAPMLEASQAFAHLLLRRMEDISYSNRIQPSFSSSFLNSLEACELTGSDVRIDEYGLEAFVTYLAALIGKDVSLHVDDDGSCRITSNTDIATLVRRYWSAFTSIAIWSDFEITLNGTAVTLRQRQ